MDMIVGWLMLLVVQLLALSVAIAFASRERRLGRVPYLVRILCMIGLVILIDLIDRFTRDVPSVPNHGISLFVQMALIVGFHVMMALWTVRRLQDGGWNRWLALTQAMPIVNLLIAFLFLIPSSRTDNQKDLAEAFD